MSAIITKKSRTETAQDYITRNFIDNTSYFYTGRNIPWNDEYSPDISISSDLQVDSSKRQRIFHKKIAETDTNLAIKRFNWETGTIYTQSDYDDDYTDYRNWNHPESPFYIYNSEGNIYKCISNNNDSLSTVEPTGQSLGYISLGDGYIWKFMLDISTIISNKFLTDSWIPIPFRIAEKTTGHTDVEGAVINGDIVTIKVTNSGNGYTVAPTITIRGNGSGCVANAVMSGETIESIQVSSAGSGYNYAEISIYGDGYDAEAIALISPGEGHGSDSVQELGAYYVIISKSIIGSENNFAPINGTYRNVGITKNIKNKSDVIITDEKFNTFNDINISNCSGVYIISEKIIGETSLTEGYVYHDPGGVLKDVIVYMVEGTFTDGERIYGQESGIVGDYVDSGSTYTDVDIWSGDIIYKENIQFLTRREIQTENFTMVIEF